jgi:hypothetical protein
MRTFITVPPNRTIEWRYKELHDGCRYQKKERTRHRCA